MNLDQKIRKIPNWPKAGVLFYDITTVFEDPEGYRYIVDELAKPYEGHPSASSPSASSGASLRVDKVVGIDARGFLLAGSVAYKLGTGVSLVRKKGKLPYKTIQRDYTLEYASNTIEMHEDTIKKGEKILLIDDLVATGGTIKAAAEMIEELGGEIVGISFVIDLPFLGGSEKLKDYNVNYLIKYDSE